MSRPKILTLEQVIMPKGKKISSQCAVGFVAMMIGFAALAYFDVRRLRQQPYHLKAYAQELQAAFWLVLPVFPFLVMGFSCVFLVLTAILEKVGLPEHLSEELIMYGQFYAPFGAVYWIIKKDWLAAERETPLLPMTAGADPACGGRTRQGKQH